MDKVSWGIVLRHSELELSDLSSFAQVHRASRAALQELLRAGDACTFPAIRRYRELEVWTKLARGYRAHLYFPVPSCGRPSSQLHGGFVPDTPIFWNFRAGVSSWELTLHDVVAGCDLPGAVPTHKLDMRSFRTFDAMAVPSDGGCVIVGRSLKGDMQLWRVHRDAEGFSAKEIGEEGVRSLADLGLLAREDSVVLFSDREARFLSQAFFSSPERGFKRLAGIWDNHAICLSPEGFWVADLEGEQKMGPFELPIPEAWSEAYLISTSVDDEGFPLVAVKLVLDEGRLATAVLSLHPDRLHPPAPTLTGRLRAGTAAIANRLKRAMHLG